MLQGCGWYVRYPTAEEAGYKTEGTYPGYYERQLRYGYNGGSSRTIVTTHPTIIIVK